MSEIERIQQQLKAAFGGPAWSGPSVLEALEGVSASRATRRPIRGAHTIWEITLHIGVWEDVVRRRALGEKYNPTDAEDWPAVKVKTPAAWAAAIRKLKAGHQALLDVVAGFDDSRLDQPLVPGGTPAYVQFHGAAQHDLYHAGQIAVLKKG
ncbi:MAG: DinB family protein [Candidatus Eiseniibacteriota bacterium]